MSQLAKNIPLVVMTDLDGTLLDHFSYSAAAAKDAISRLNQHQIPIIFNTSKTSAEVINLRQQLGNQAPYVCENGSAIYLPEPADLPTNNTTASHQPEILGVCYSSILACLNELRQAGFKFRGFNDMTATEVAALTGLDPLTADFAKQRHASEPLIWNDNEKHLQDFQAQLKEYQLHMVKGGRFWHVMGQTDKASGVDFFREYYQQQWQQAPIIIGLGDGQNDIAMLNKVDYPIIIPGNKEVIELERDDVIKATKHGPEGWSEAINPLLDQLL